MSFFTDNDTLIPVQWFFADPAAKTFPTSHKFGSANWTGNAQEVQGPGEIIPSPRPYAKGYPPPFDGSTGPGFAGTKFNGAIEDFQEGATYTTATVGNESTGLCAGCSGQPFQTWCRDVVSWNFSNLKMTITAVSSPSSPPVGTVGQTFNFMNAGDGVWADAFTPIYPPTGRNGTFLLLCEGTPPVILFNLRSLTGGIPPDEDKPFVTLAAPTSSGGTLQIITGWMPQQTALGGSEVWTMVLTLA